MGVIWELERAGCFLAVQGIGGGKGKPNEPKMGFRQSQRSIVPMIRIFSYRKGGELCPQGPTVGKAKPGITIWQVEPRRFSEAEQRVT